MGSSRAKRDRVAEGNDPKGEAQPSNPSGRAIFSDTPTLAPTYKFQNLKICFQFCFQNLRD
jgi:hypothetical protein